MMAFNFGDDRLPERFWSKVQPCPMSGCWNWTGANNRGYGSFHVDQMTGRRAAHRWAYRVMVADVPRELVIDHLCRNPSCVNPGHLEPVTNQENTVRGLCSQVQVERARKVVRCPFGHEYTPDNVRFSVKPCGSRSRTCLLCDRVRSSRKYKQALRALIVSLTAELSNAPEEVSDGRP